MSNVKKTCVTCRENKNSKDFGVDKRNKSGYRNECKNCYNFKRNKTKHINLAKNINAENTNTTNISTETIEKLVSALKLQIELGTIRSREQILEIQRSINKEIDNVHDSLFGICVDIDESQNLQLISSASEYIMRTRSKLVRPEIKVIDGKSFIDFKCEISREEVTNIMNNVKIIK